MTGEIARIDLLIRVVVFIFFRLRFFCLLLKNKKRVELLVFIAYP
jgi:hypothetical protein